MMGRGHHFRPLKGERAATPTSPSLHVIPPAFRRTFGLYPKAPALGVIAADRHRGPQERPNAVPLRFEHPHVLALQTDVVKGPRFAAVVRREYPAVRLRGDS